MPYFTYIMECKDGTFYTGVSNDLKRRFNQHKNRKGGRYTQAHQVSKIAHVEEFKTKSEALKREMEIKGWRREKKLGLINQR